MENRNDLTSIFKFNPLFSIVYHQIIMQIHPAWKIRQPDNANIATMLSYPPRYYQQRLDKLGFKGKDKTLLDAGCGAGHWLVAAAKLNKEVYGIDATLKYLNVAKEIIKSLQIGNCKLKIGKLEKMPYKDNFFDYIICYSVWMFTDKEKTLREFYRVLKPQGKLYLGSLIGPGWYPKLISQGIKEGKPHLILDSFQSILKRIPLSLRKTQKLLATNHFRIIGDGADGEVGSKKIQVEPIYKDKAWQVFEVLAEKR